MNRKQFMEQLERLLSDISEAERQEALEYYEGYFDDAGPENEGEVSFLPPLYLCTSRCAESPSCSCSWRKSDGRASMRGSALRRGTA